jgi:hypothetical protein
MIISRSLTPLNSSKTCGAFADLRMVGRRRQLAPEDAECPWRQLGQRCGISVTQRQFDRVADAETHA